MKYLLALVIAVVFTSFLSVAEIKPFGWWPPEISHKSELFTLNSHPQSVMFRLREVDEDRLRFELLPSSELDAWGLGGALFSSIAVCYERYLPCAGFGC